MAIMYLENHKILLWEMKEYWNRDTLCSWIRRQDYFQFKSQCIPGSSLVVQWVGALTVWVQTLVWELSSHRLHSMAKKQKSQWIPRLSEGLVDCFLAKRRELGAGRNWQLTLKLKWRAPVIPASLKAEAGRSLELRSSGLQLRYADPVSALSSASIWWPPGSGAQVA